MTPPPAIAINAPEVGATYGTNYKSDPSFYAPVDFKKNGVDIAEATKSLKISADKKGPSYPAFLPTWDRSFHQDPYVLIENPPQRGLAADPKKPNLLPSGTKVTSLTPKFGTEVRGVQLSSLSDAGKNELSLLVAERGVVVFRDQDFVDLGPKALVEYGKYFGELHVHPVTGHPVGYPELHVVYRGPEQPGGRPSVGRLPSVTSVAWHSDVTYEINPPSTTFLAILDLPESDGQVRGGDTLFLSQAHLLSRLSQPFQDFLSTLSAVHSGYEQAADALSAGGYVRREPVSNVHPVVRVHPVTGVKALFVNEQFTRYIVGVKKEESDALLRLLYDVQARLGDGQVRVKWEKGTVVVWDNRITAHSAILDFEGERRHAIRITPRGEKPIPVEK